MSELYIKNGTVITPHLELVSNITILNGVIKAITPNLTNLNDEFKVIDATNCYVTPGLIDLQFNGNKQCNLWDNPSEADFKSMCKQLAKNGTTSFLPTLITADINQLLKLIDFLKTYVVNLTNSPLIRAPDISSTVTRVLGLHLEGPFISQDRAGVHPKEFIKDPNVDIAKILTESNMVRLVTLASERDKEHSVSKYLLSKGIKISLGHSNATFTEAYDAFNNGFNLVTHLFNAMPPIHHRKPGLITQALLTSHVSTCIIPDGLHVEPCIIELVVKLKGVNKVIFVTDSAFIGTSEGNLVGSSLTLDYGVRNLVKWNICSFKEAIQMATLNCAYAMDLNNLIGELAVGRLADIVIWDKETLKIRQVIIGGNIISSV